MRFSPSGFVIFAVLAAFGCGGESSPEPLFPERAECEGESIVPLAGKHAMVISFLEVGAAEDGFDLDRDGMPDNQLAGVGTLARGAIEDSFENFEIVIPFEFFDVGDEVAADECVKFALYVGQYKLDRDGDGAETASGGGDCNDQDDQARPGAAERDNRRDDNCNGFANGTIETDGDGNETVTFVGDDPDVDMDGDGFSPMDGDCDDTDDAISPDAAEVCGDGRDNDCDGVADFGDDGSGNPACSPYEEPADQLALDPLGFNADGSPVVAFSAGSIVENGGTFQLEAGPSIFSIGIPVTDGLILDLRISGASIVGDLSMTPGGWAIRNGRLGGVIDANTSDKITGLEVDEIGLSAEDTFLDATYANILGTILGLPRVTIDGIECQTPDIDVDQDGIEAFCDTDPLDEVKKVDMCVDGNGDVIMDELDGDGNVVTHCTQAVDADGNPRFVDGISVEINFETMPTLLPESLPPL